MRLFQSLYRANHLYLSIKWQRGGYAIWIDFPNPQSFRFKKYLMRCFFGKPHDLVLHRRAVAWTGAVDTTIIDRRAIQRRPDHLMSPFIGASDMAYSLPRMFSDAAGKRKYRRRIIARLHGTLSIINGPAVNPWRRPGLQASDTKRQFPQTVRQCDRRRLTSATALMIFPPIWILPPRKVPTVKTTQGA